MEAKAVTCFYLRDAARVDLSALYFSLLHRELVKAKEALDMQVLWGGLSVQNIETDKM